MMLIALMCVCTFQACYEEKEIIPREQEMALRFEFPQGNNSWDEDLAAIYEEFGVCFIYKDLDSTDLERSWTGGDLASKYRGENLNDEQVEFYTNSFKSHVFAYLNPEVTQKALPPYWYMMYDFHAEFTFGTIVLRTDVAFAQDGLDFWVTCMEGEYNAMFGTQIVRPSTPKEWLDWRGRILSEIFAEACDKGTIVIPEEFHVGFDYRTEVTYLDGYEQDENYYKRRGFPGRLGTTLFEFYPLSTIEATNREDNFWQYINLGMCYSKEEYEAMYPPSEYPLMHEKRQYVIDYMKDAYNVDLEAIHDGPQL